MIKIVIAGAAGRIGQAIISYVQEYPDITIVSGLEASDHPACKAGNVLGIPVTADQSIIKDCDILIDFTSPESTLKHLETAVKLTKPVVIGTTGISDTQQGKIRDASQKIPIVFSPNMSSGVNLLYKLAESAARALKSYDMEIIEAHHNKKKDAPSGTAIQLGSIVSRASGHRHISYGRSGDTAERKKDEICIHAVRAGDIVGEHTVVFAGPGERIELVHRAHSRTTFAAGAIRAAQWLKGKKPGLYTMGDVLEKD